MLKYSETESRRKTEISQMPTVVRMILRKIGLIHSCERKSDWRTQDIKFNVVATEDGSKMTVVIQKTCIPRSYPIARIFDAKDFIASETGFLTKILENKKAILICLNSEKHNSPEHQLSLAT